MTRRCAIVHGVLVAAAPILVVVHTSAARSQVGATACADETRCVTAARSLLAAHRAEEARALLKSALARLPDARELSLLLGVAYSQLGNHFWAMRSLAPLVGAEPPDCVARVWMAWSHLQVGALDAAAAVLAAPECDGNDALATRACLLSALVAHYANDSAAAAAALARARAAAAAYPADRAALTALSRMVSPARLEDVSWDAEMRGGHTTNALLEAPTDPTAHGGRPSAFVQTDLRLRGIAPSSGSTVRLAAELQARLLQHTAAGARELSYGRVAGWAGVYVGSLLPRLRLGYRPELLNLGLLDAAGERAGVYYQAHRADFEAEVTPWLTVLGGGGRRWFVSEPVRDRWEQDAGAGGNARLQQWLSFMWGISGRRHRVLDSRQRYGLLGATAMAGAQARLVRGLFARVTGTVAADRYPHWSRRPAQPEEEPAAAEIRDGGPRDDRLVKVLAELLGPPLAGARLSVAYEYAARHSTEPGYAMQAHRVLLRLRWNGSLDLGLPPDAAEEPLADIAWGLRVDEPAPDERIQDILRQDEQMQNVCGCGG